MILKGRGPTQKAKMRADRHSFIFVVDFELDDDNVVVVLFVLFGFLLWLFDALNVPLGTSLDDYFIATLTDVL